MSQVKLYQNMLATQGYSYANFSISGCTAVDSFGYEHLYSMDSVSEFRASGTGSNAYIRGQWTSLTDSDIFSAMYVAYGDCPYVDLIDVETSDPEIGTWSLVTKTDVVGVPDVVIVTSGVYVNQPTSAGKFLLKFSAVSNTRSRYRIAIRKDSAATDVGSFKLSMVIPLQALTLPEAARTREEKHFVYGANRETTLGGKSQYSSYGADPRKNLIINYEYIDDDDKTTLTTLYESCNGGTYPFVIEIDSVPYPVRFVSNLGIQEEQAGLYNITLNLETL